MYIYVDQMGLGIKQNWNRWNGYKLPKDLDLWHQIDPFSSRELGGVWAWD